MNRKRRIAVLARGLDQLIHRITADDKREYDRIRAKITFINNSIERTKDPKKKKKLREELDKLFAEIKKTKQYAKKEKARNRKAAKPRKRRAYAAADSVLDDATWKKLETNVKQFSREWGHFLKNEVDLSGMGVEIKDLIKDHAKHLVKVLNMIKKRQMGSKAQKYIEHTIEDELLKDELLEVIRETVGEDKFFELFDYE